MNRLPKLFLFLLCFALNTSVSPAQNSDNPGFTRIKTLLGEWEGKTQNGSVAHASYQLVSGGTALMETLRLSNEPEMMTLYTADGARVAITHYCGTANQPRMRTAVIEGNPKTLDFYFVGATNLATPLVGHMQHLSLSFEDAEHLQVWTWSEGGKDTTRRIQFARSSRKLSRKNNPAPE
jgi:hypothetical protein